MGATTAHVEPLDPHPGDETLGRLPAYTWIVVTSGQGVKALTLKLAARDALVPKATRWAAVGPATARALAGIGVAVEITADDPRGEGLARALAPHLSVRDRVLVVRPEGTPHTLLAAALRAAGAHVDEAPLYRTIPSADAVRLARAAVAGRYDAIVWTAPSTLTQWLAATAGEVPGLRDALTAVWRIAIGPTTAAALALEGFPADEVAQGPEEAQIGDAILRAAANMPPPRGGRT